MKKSFNLRLLVVIIVVAVIPLILENLFNYPLEVGIQAGFFVMLAVSLVLLVGLLGEISLGHAAFYGIGAYTTAILSSRWGWSPLFTIPLGALMGALMGFLIGYPVLKLKGYYLALATLGVGMAAQEFFKAAAPITGGEMGIYNLPNISLGKLEFSSYLSHYYLVWMFALIFVFLCQRLSKSPMGKRLKAIHSDEWAAESVGINVPAAKLYIFTLSTGLAGFAGALFAHCAYGTVSPGDFGVMFSIKIVTMVIIGGMYSVYGAAGGAVLLSLLPEIIRRLGDRAAIDLTQITHIQDIVFGVILIIFVIFAPGGLIREGKSDWANASD